MANMDQRDRWMEDTKASVTQYNKWYLSFAPEAYNQTRKQTAELVALTLKKSDYLSDISHDLLCESPEVLSVLRMCTAPPIARDRLVGLSRVPKSLVYTMEKDSRIPPRMEERTLEKHLRKIGEIVRQLADPVLFPWIKEGRAPLEEEVNRAAIVVGDRVCGAVADPIIRNAQETRQLEVIRNLLEKHGYKESKPDQRGDAFKMPSRTFSFHLNVPVKDEEGASINMPIDAVIMPPDRSKGPLLVEAKSAGDFTNVNKRRKEEATKMRQLTDTYKDTIRFILFLCGYFDQNYLAYEAASGIDWVWEHRPEDLMLFGL